MSFPSRELKLHRLPNFYATFTDLEIRWRMIFLNFPTEAEKIKKKLASV